MTITKYGKRFLSLLVALVFALVLTACATQADVEARGEARDKVDEVLANIHFEKPEETVSNLEFAIREEVLKPGDDLENPVFEHKYGGVVEVISSNPDVLNVKWVKSTARQSIVEFVRDANGNIIYAQKDSNGKLFYIDKDGNRQDTTTQEGEAVTVVTGLDFVDVYKLVGQITRPAYQTDDVTVEVTFKVSQDYKYEKEGEEVTATYSSSKKISFTILAESSPLYEGTIAELKAEALENYTAAIKYPVNFNGTVTAVHYREGQFQVADNTGGLFVYSIVDGIQVGDYVNVQGNITQYYGILQVGSDINVTRLGTATEPVQPIQMTLEEIAALVPDAVVGNGFGGQYIEAEGYFRFYEDKQGQPNYHLVDVKGNEVQIYYKSHTAWEEPNVLDNHLGKYVRMRFNIYTYFAAKELWQVSFNLLDFTFVEIDEPVVPDSEKIAYDKADIEALSGSILAGEKFDLITTGGRGSTITWSADQPELIDANGVVGEGLLENKTLTLTATLTLGEETTTAVVTLDIIANIPYKSVTEALETPVGEMIYVQGYVKSIVNTTYGNVYLQDLDGNEIYIYGIGPKDSFLSYGISVGDFIGVYGQRAVYNGTAQMSSTTYMKHFPEYKVITVADILAKEVGTDYFTVKGTVSNIVNTTYGNFDLVDEDGTKIYVYGLLTPEGVNKQFASMGIKEGDTLWLIGQRAAYNNTPQIGNARFVKVVSGSTDAEKLEKDAEAIPTTFGVKTGKFDLPTTGSFGSAIAWEVVSGTAVTIVDNVVTEVVRPAQGAGNETVTLKATLTLGEEEAVEVTVTVEIAEEVASGELELVVDVTFGDLNLTGYANDKELKVTNVVDGSELNIIGHRTQITNGSAQAYATGSLAVICPTRANHNPPVAFLQFSNLGEVTKLQFDVSWWSPADEKDHASKLVKLEVQISTNGTDWTSLGDIKDKLDATQWTEVMFEGFVANYVRVLAEGDKSYTSNQNVRVVVDNFKLYR